MRATCGRASAKRSACWAFPSVCASVPGGTSRRSTGLAIATRQVDVVRGRGPQALELGAADLADPFRRASEDHGAPRNDGSWCDQRASADETLGSDDGAVEDDRAHPDQAAVLDRTPVQHDVVTDGDAVAEQRGETVA